MKIHKRNSHVIIRFMCLLICLMGALSIGAYYSEVKEGMRAEASKLSLSLEDNAIIIKWDFPDWHLCDYVTGYYCI